MLPTMLDNSRTHDTSGHEEAGVPPARCAKRRRKSSGQSLVEFAVLLPMLVFILAVAADFGRAFTAYIAISGAAREGAAYGMQSSANASNTAMIQQRAIDEADSPWGTDPTVTSIVEVEDEVGSSYDKLTVTVSYTFSPLFPLPSFPPLPAIPDSIVMSREVSMRVLN